MVNGRNGNEAGEGEWGEGEMLKDQCLMFNCLDERDGGEFEVFGTSTFSLQPSAFESRGREF